MSDFTMGYVMGLIVGEGSFSSSPRPRLTIKMNSSDIGPMEQVQELLGGNIYGPYIYERKGGGKPFDFRIWYVEGPSLIAVLPLIDKHLPASRKRVQFIRWRAQHNI